MTGNECPACHGTMNVFHEQRGVPVNSCLLVDTRQEAEQFPRGDIRLGFCRSCGFICNTAFDPRQAQYNQRYEETQGYSPHFRDFARSLAQRWIDRYDIHGREILEIGCGKGEFLATICDLGGNRGIGIDPSGIPERLEGPGSERVTIVPDFYDERYAGIPADVVICRHTLEHIAPVDEFMRMVRSAIGRRWDTIVLFELPDVARVLAEAAFWDVYYEHCSYFSLGSVVRLFRRTGFRVLDAALAYDGQYIVIEARPRQHRAAETSLDGEDDLGALARGTSSFADGYQRLVDRWRRELTQLAKLGGRTAIWGSGSKGVSYLSAVGPSTVGAAIDINPNKQGKYLAGTGHKVLAPAALSGFRPDLVVAMNPAYLAEIRVELDHLGVDAQLQAV